MAFTKLSVSKERIELNDDVFLKTEVESMRTANAIEQKLSQRGKALDGHSITMSRDPVTGDPIVTVTQTGKR